jgi:anti-sigma factor RsiW
MKNFEERYTAWLDGTLNERERQEFEAELPDREAASKDAADWKKLRGLLRENLAAAPMPHADFLNSQVLAAIQRESPAPKVPARGWFPVGRLVWSGAFLLAIAVTLSVFILPSIRSNAPTDAQFVSQVVAAHVGDQKHGAYAFAAPGGRGAVLWVEDAGYIPANERIK